MSDLRKYVGNRSPFDDLRHIEDDGTEWWSAREMMPYLGYERFENLENVLRKAKSACRNTNHSVDSIFRDVTKNAGRGRNYKDVQMTRFGAYLVAMNGDPDKPEIAAAQRYFAVQTYRAETQIPAVETVHIQQLRPWGERLSDTFKDHHGGRNLVMPSAHTS